MFSKIKFSALALATATLIGATFNSVQATPLDNLKVKWSQLPDMDQGTDYLSMHRSFGPVVADDFQSNGKPIAGFRWWGSYFQGTRQGADRDVSFEISFHEDCPANDATCNNGGPFPYSTPSDGNYFSAIVTAQEKFFGTTMGGEDVYEYWLSVEGTPGPAFLGGTWNEVAGEIYWLDVAWAAGQFSTNISDDVWGWHESNQHNLDFAVTTAPGGSSNPHIGPWNLLDGKDMAFQVLSVPEPGTLALFGLGLAGLGIARRRKAA